MIIPECASDDSETLCLSGAGTSLLMCVGARSALARLQRADFPSVIRKPVARSHLQTLASGTSAVFSRREREAGSNRYEKQRWRDPDISEPALPE